MDVTSPIYPRLLSRHTSLQRPRRSYHSGKAEISGFSQLEQTDLIFQGSDQLASHLHSLEASPPPLTSSPPNQTWSNILIRPCSDSFQLGSWLFCLAQQCSAWLHTRITWGVTVFNMSCLAPSRSIKPVLLGRGVTMSSFQSSPGACKVRSELKSSNPPLFPQFLYASA